MNIRIISILPEKAAEMSQAAGVTFSLLEDRPGRVMDYLGLRHVGGDPANPGQDIPQSASFLFNPDGKVIWVHIARNYRVRPKPETILTRAREYLSRQNGEF